MQTYVLVHGGGHGGWCYQPLARILRAAGHEVYTPTLTGLGERSHLLSTGIDLDTQIQDVVSVLEFEDLDNVILVGHSYGGLVVTGAADRVPDRVGHLVYLDSFNPANGQSLVDIAGFLMEASRAASRTIDGVELVLFPGTDPDGDVRRHRPRLDCVDETQTDTAPVGVFRAEVGAGKRGRDAKDPAVPHRDHDDFAYA